VASPEAARSWRGAVAPLSPQQLNAMGGGRRKACNTRLLHTVLAQASRSLDGFFEPEDLASLVQACPASWNLADVFFCYEAPLDARAWRRARRTLVDRCVARLAAIMHPRAVRLKLNALWRADKQWCDSMLARAVEASWVGVRLPLVGVDAVVSDFCFSITSTSETRFAHALPVMLERWRQAGPLTRRSALLYVHMSKFVNTGGCLAEVDAQFGVHAQVEAFKARADALQAVMRGCAASEEAEVLLAPPGDAVQQMTALALLFRPLRAWDQLAGLCRTVLEAVVIDMASA